ncbi:MAG: hypothetical protein ABIR91_04535 [Candidatus Saccharimonadales bacterium]
MSKRHQSMAAPLTARPQTVSKKFFIATVVIVALVGFVTGTRSDAIMGVIAPIVGIHTPAGQIDLTSVQDVYKQLAANYDGDLN